ncbi:hypothetical protein EGI11_00020 [Chryseobacterium sp. H3056]|uniref:Uncharacterized protein n=1 Tax=Kaistella daneshvariae TaxID=2487074 RepID=A0A3N0WZD7_9FLAO|nr:hypothetical protein [Kaistella daneshvariae]ROI10335.1 hypothetical protein EGI11_00020 [Kaistella daneshvariae]
MNLTIIYNPKPKFDNEFYYQEREKIILKFNAKIKNSNSYISKAKFSFFMKLELLKLSPLVNSYLKINKK